MKILSEIKILLLSKNESIKIDDMANSLIINNKYKTEEMIKIILYYLKI